MEVYRKDELNNRMVHTGLTEEEYIQEHFGQEYGLSDEAYEKLGRGVYLTSNSHESTYDFQKAQLVIDEDFFDEEDVEVLKNVKIDISDIYLSDITRPIDSDDDDVDFDDKDENEEFFVELKKY